MTRHLLIAASAAATLVALTGCTAAPAAIETPRMNVTVEIVQREASLSNADIEACLFRFETTNVSDDTIKANDFTYSTISNPAGDILDLDVASFFDMENDERVTSNDKPYVQAYDAIWQFGFEQKEFGPGETAVYLDGADCAVLDGDTVIEIDGDFYPLNL
jgi:hypothetical protein